MEERELSLREIIERIERIFGYKLEDTDIKFTEYGMKSIINDVFSYDIQLVKSLRNETGCGLYQAKNALELCDYDVNVAKEYLRLSTQALVRYKVVDGNKIPFTEKDYVDLAKKVVNHEMN